MTVTESAWTTMPSPVGELRLEAAGAALTGIGFEPWAEPAGVRGPGHPVLAAAVHQLTAYFDGSLRSFDLPLEPRGTDFQRRVWARLQEIPYGSTASYGEVARALGLAAGASRAVGLANGRNPLPIVVPCHRVVGADGTLTGYGGGVERKQILLSLESGALF
jgi:methylated-DNA-[protein]-cysteine S-methyltransferase